MSYNIMGLYSPTKQKNPKQKINKENTDILFIQETKFLEINIQSRSQNIWWGNMVFGQSVQGFLGGLEILWNPKSIHIRNLVASIWCLSMYVKFIGSSTFGFLTNIFGITNPHKNEFFFQFPEQTSKYLSILERIGGYFNTITILKGKKGFHVLYRICTKFTNNMNIFN